MFMPTTVISERFQIVVKWSIKSVKVQTQHVGHGLHVAIFGKMDSCWFWNSSMQNANAFVIQAPSHVREQNVIPNNTRQ